MYYVGLWQCSPGKGSIHWYISGMPSSLLIGAVLNSIHSFTQNKPKMCFICTTLIPTTCFIYAGYIYAEQPPLTNHLRKSSEVQEDTAKQDALRL